MSKKVWVIDAGATPPPRQAATPSVQPRRARRRNAIGERSSRPALAVLPVPPSTAPAPSAGSVAWLTAGAYAIGPLAILLTPDRRRPERVAAAILALGACAILVKAPSLLQEWVRVGSVALAPWLLVATVSTLIAFTCWARAVHLIGRNRVWIEDRIPGWLRAPLAVGTLGLVVPGLGWWLVGRHRRAALALWAVGPLLLSAFLLAHATTLWDGGRLVGGAASDLIEHVFLGAAVVAVAATAIWIGQALDAARHARRRRSGPARGVEHALVGLLAAALVFTTIFDTAILARELDRRADRMQVAGMRCLPLYLTQLAMRFDPWEPSYALDVIALHEARGEHGAANRVREAARGRWTPLADALRAIETPRSSGS